MVDKIIPLDQDAINRMIEVLNRAYYKRSNPNRIMPFLMSLGDYWQRHPDLRFGQLVENIVGTRSVFQIEDEDFLEALKGYGKNNTGTTPSCCESKEQDGPTLQQSEWQSGEERASDDALRQAPLRVPDSNDG